MHVSRLRGFVGLILFATSCGLLPAQPSVVTTNPVLLDVIRVLGADDVLASSLVPAGVSPRAFDPTPETVRALGEARLLVVQGLDYDAWIDAVVRDAGFRGEVVVATDRMPLLDVEGRVYEPEDEVELDFSQFDPHVWHDPRNVIHAARIVAIALADLLPARASVIEERLQSYIRELEELHAYAEGRFRSLDPGRRRLATSHDVFAYFGAVYDLQIGLIPGFEPGRAPQPAQLARMIDLVRSMEVPAIFLGAGTASLAIQEIESETGVHVITTLFTETLGHPGSPDGSYTVRFRRNVDLIVDALR
jgi:ABC-type Zn uptake system ZnuABC Zn-binding protein ZnuA